MASIRTGVRPHKQEGRTTLTVRPPHYIESALAAGNFDPDCVAHATCWGNAMLAARDLWADQNRHGRRYSDVETARHQNALARGKRGGR